MKVATRRAEADATPVTALTLLYTLLAFCAACVFLCVSALFRNRILTTPFMDLLTSLALVYATPVSVIVASTLPADKRHRPVRYPRPAIVLLVMWNLMLLIPFIQFSVNQDMQAKDVMDFCDGVAKHWTFLISGVLAFTSTSAHPERP